MCLSIRFKRRNANRVLLHGSWLYRRRRSRNCCWRCAFWQIIPLPCRVWRGHWLTETPVLKPWRRPQAIWTNLWRRSHRAMVCGGWSWTRLVRQSVVRTALSDSLRQGEHGIFVVTARALYQLLRQFERLTGWCAYVGQVFRHVLRKGLRKRTVATYRWCREWWGLQRRTQLSGAGGDEIEVLPPSARPLFLIVCIVFFY